jgi:cation diffusion facilitator CzcD-associated flavoprotein CzcO
MPKQDDPFDENMLNLFRSDPNTVKAARDHIYAEVDAGMTFSDPAAMQEMADSVIEALQVVEDPEVREKLVPRHPIGAKRPLFSNDYYAAFNRPNLELVTDGVARITKDAIVTVDGKERRIGTLILATGFATTKYLSAIEVTGRGGVRLEDAWNDGPTAYMGSTTPGFPNLFMLYGPNTNNGSIITMIESQVEYALRQIRRLDEEGLAWLDVRPEAMAAYNDEIQRGLEAVEPWQDECNGYYRSPSGRIVTQWPFSMSEYHERATRPDAEAYEAAPRSEAPAA